MTKSLKSLIEYRLQSSDESMFTAKLLFENHQYRDCVNRLYYSCFYAVLALLLTADSHAKTHKGILNLFYQHFIATGIIDDKHNLFFTKLFQTRIQGDYEDFAVIEQHNIEGWIDKAEDFIAAIKTYIDTLK